MNTHTLTLPICFVMDNRNIRTQKNVEKETGETFNSCLPNLYHNGDEGLAWQSDKKTDLKKDGAIGSLSFVAKRKFAFKHKTTK